MGRLTKQTMDGNVETLLLAILQAGPSYGYAIVKELNERAAGILQMGEGTVYPVLHRLEERGLISSFWSEARGRKRKYYRLTTKGKKAFTSNCIQWQLMSKVIGEFIGSVGETAQI